MTTSPHPVDPAPATVADLVEHWTGVREHGPLAPATAAAYLGAIARILERQGITADTRLDELDLDTLGDRFAAANPDLKSVTLANYTNNLRSAVNGYHARRHRPAPAASSTPFIPPPGTPAPEPGPAHPGVTAERPRAAPQPARLDGTLATLPAFLALAGQHALLERRTAQIYAATARTILDTQPHLATRQVADLDPAEVTATFASHHPALTGSALAAYGTKLAAAVHACLAYLQDPATPTAPPAREHAARPASGPPAQVALPRGRAVSLHTPADLTDAEARAAAAVLRLHHPGMFTAEQPPTEPPLDPGAGRWTLVFWPEHAPDQPQAAHITGETFRAALAHYARARHPDRVRLDDSEAIDAWFSSDVFFVRVIDGHHEAIDAGALL